MTFIPSIQFFFGSLWNRNEKRSTGKALNTTEYSLPLNGMTNLARIYLNDLVRTGDFFRAFLHYISMVTLRPVPSLRLYEN
jgi:hypothetical protein